MKNTKHLLYLVVLVVVMSGCHTVDKGNQTLETDYSIEEIEVQTETVELAISQEISLKDMVLQEFEELEAIANGMHINILDNWEDTILFTIDDVSKHPLIYQTIGIYTYEMNTQALIELKRIEEGIRIWDCRYMDETLYYTTIEPADIEELFIISVIAQRDKTITIIDQGYTFTPQNTPSFGVSDGIYYIMKSFDIKEIEMDNVTRLTATFCKIEGLSKIEIHSIENLVTGYFEIHKEQEYIYFTEFGSSNTMVSFFSYEGKHSNIYYYKNDTLQKVVIENTIINRVSPLEEVILTTYFDTDMNKDQYQCLYVDEKRLVDIDGEVQLAREKIVEPNTIITMNTQMNIISIKDDVLYVKVIANPKLQNQNTDFVVTDNHGVICAYPKEQDYYFVTLQLGD